MAPPAKKQAQSFGALPAAAKVFLGILLGAIIGLVYYLALHTPLVTEIEEADGTNMQLRQHQK